MIHLTTTTAIHMNNSSETYKRMEEAIKSSPKNAQIEIKMDKFAPIIISRDDICGFYGKGFCFIDSCMGAYVPYKKVKSLNINIHTFEL